MVQINAKVRKWGDSLAVIIPKEIAHREKIRVEDKVHLNISKETDLSDVFGILKGKLEKSAQEIKDELRKEWK